jgi:hypothetical protein
MFESLRRWMGVAKFEEALPLDLTISAMDAGSVEIGLTAAGRSVADTQLAKPRSRVAGGEPPPAKGPGPSG